MDRILDLLSDTFAGAIFGMEAVMTTELCLFYIMILVDPQRIKIYGFSTVLTSTQYLIISIISSYVKTAFEDIAVALYDSDWYWLNQNEKRDVLKILQLAQKPKAFPVGVFNEANLERFTDVSK